MTPEIREILAELKQRFQQLYGERLVKMLLYGSHARGDARAGSDIDVLVVPQGPVSFEEEIARASHMTADLCLEHNVVFSRFFVSDDCYHNHPTPVVSVARREGVRI